MSEQIVQVQDAATPTKNMRTIQQTAGGNTVQSEVIVLATGAANGGGTYDARQFRTLTSSDIVTAVLQAGSQIDVTDRSSRVLGVPWVLDRISQTNKQLVGVQWSTGAALEVEIIGALSPLSVSYGTTGLASANLNGIGQSQAWAFGAAYPTFFAGGFWSGTIAFEATPNNADWFPVFLYNLTTRTWESSTTDNSIGKERAWQMPNPGGWSQLRFRVTNWIAGAAAVGGFTSPSTNTPSLDSNSTTGLPVPPSALLVGGSDGTNLQPLMVDSNNSLKVNVQQVPFTQAAKNGWGPGWGSFRGW